MRRLLHFFHWYTPEETCILAYKLFLEEIPVEEVHRRLCKVGIPNHLAARAVTFMPSAFARSYYFQQGYNFPDRYYPGIAAYRKGFTKKYSDDKVFQAAVRLAAQLTRDGDWVTVWRFIEISSEFAGVQKAIALGQTPTSFEVFIHEF